ncbi:MAG: hypothetical protein RLZZ502_113 [Pseudomonadota bacterium]
MMTELPWWSAEYWLLQWQLFSYYLHISFLTFGGSITTLPDQYRFLVDSKHLLTATEFNSLFAISQASPGPNILYVALFGWKIAGAPAAFLCLLGICLPSSVFVLALERLARRDPGARWLRVIRTGLAPMTVGLILAAGTVLARPVWLHWWMIGLMGLAVSVTYLSKRNPMILIVIGALLGALMSVLA